MRPMVFTRGMFIGQIIVALGLIAAVLWIGLLNRSLHDQQIRTRNLARVNNTLIQRDTRTLTLVCKLTTGLALNQPNLDPQFLRILNDIVGELPTKCFP